MRLNEELKRTISDFLCTECKSLLYFDVKNNDEVCVNPDCILYPPFLKLHDVSQAEVLRKELRNKEAILKLRIIRTYKPSFIRFLYEQRSITTKNVLTQGRAEFEKLLLIDELLILVNSLNFNGRIRDSPSFFRILRDYAQFFGVENFIEDVENHHVLLSADKGVYMLKYWEVIMELYKSYGIVVGRATDTTDVFKHDKIDRQTREEIDFQLDTDIVKFFEQVFNHITALKYTLERYYRTAKQHDYDPSGLDIAVLLGLFFSARGKTIFGQRKELRRHYDVTCFHSKVKGNFNSFEDNYVTSKKNAPIIVCDGTSYIFDRETILFYLFYLVGTNRRKVEGQRDTGEERIVKKKQQAAVVFEKYVREHLRKCGFTGPEEPLIVSEQNEKHEYDVIGVKESSKEIVLVEAKYRDFSPSSLTGRTLIQQELLEEDSGLLVEAIRHQARLEFFQKYFDRFEKELSLQSPRDQYSISAWIVTKHPPLISKYRQVSIIVYDEFCEKFSSVVQTLG